MWAAFRNPLEVLGTDGIIEVPSAYITGEPGSGNFFISAKGQRREIEVPHVNAYSEQADHLARAIIDGTPLQFNASDAVKNMKVIDACLLSARERARITL
jgi:predicted dehydrogenase